MADPSSKVLLFSLLLFFFFMKKVESQDTFFQIVSFSASSGQISFQRDAFIPRQESFVRLTQTDSSGYPWLNSVGRALYNRPIDLWGFRKQASFDTNVTLRVAAPPHHCQIDSNRIGHGITFFMVPVNSIMPTGGSGQYLGIFDAVAPATPVFAIKFNGANGEGYFFNPPYSHVGININSLKSQNFTRWDPGFVTARITYDARTKLISVAAGEARVSFFFDLATVLPQRVQVGLSAATGNPRVAYLDAIRWNFRSTMQDDIVSTGGSTETNTNAKPFVVS